MSGKMRKKRIFIEAILLALVLGVLLSGICLFPEVAVAAPPDKPDKITVTGPDADVDIYVVGEGSSVTVNDDELATQAGLQTLAGRSGSQGDLNTWVAARRADKWVSEVGTFLPSMITRHILETEEMSVEQKNISERLAATEATTGSNTEETVTLRGELDALTIKDVERKEKFEALQQELLNLKNKWLIGTVITGGLCLVLAILTIGRIAVKEVRNGTGFVADTKREGYLMGKV
jgi:hypothetical protein